MVVGLTGGIGSGKTTVAKLFSKFNDVAIYIADIEAKKLMNSSEIIKKKLIKQFGESSFVNQKLNRNYISEIVFNDKEKLSILNAIVHPEVKKHFQDFIKKILIKHMLFTKMPFYSKAEAIYFAIISLRFMPM